MSRNIHKKDCPFPKPTKPVSKTAKGACSLCHLQKQEYVGSDNTHESCCRRICKGWKTCFILFHHPEAMEDYRSRLNEWERRVEGWLADQRSQQASERSQPTAKQQAAHKEKEMKKINQTNTILQAPELETALRQAFAGSEVKKVAQPILLSALMQYTRGEDIAPPNSKKRKIDALNQGNMNSDAAILEELTKAKIDPQEYIRMIHRLVQQVFLKIIEDLSTSEDYDVLSAQPPTLASCEPKPEPRRQKKESQVRPIYFSGGKLIDVLAPVNNNNLTESEIEELKAMDARKQRSERETVRYLTSKIARSKPHNRGFPDPKANAFGPVMRSDWTKEMEEAKTVSIHSDSDTDEYSVDEIWKENDFIARNSNCEM